MLPRTILYLIVLLIVAGGCQNDDLTVRLEGETMGTTYTVVYQPVAAALPDARAEIEAVLADINQSLSTYIDTSLISRINASADTLAQHPVDEHFVAVFTRAREIYRHTEGAFNPAVGPLVQAWGFGPKLTTPPDSQTVAALLRLIDFDAFELIPGQSPALRKHLAGAQLDFSAIAKGYGVDRMGGWLEDQGIAHYFVEIGGEVRARGQHPEGRPWRTGLERPDENRRELYAVINLRDASLATSGNYRNFFVREGQKVVHTLNPATGYPEINTLLSATVLAPDCMTADAYATAFMVMGYERATTFLNNNPDLEAFLLASRTEEAYAEFITPGLAQQVVDRNQ